MKESSIWIKEIKLFPCPQSCLSPYMYNSYLLAARHMTVPQDYTTMYNAAFWIMSYKDGDGSGDRVIWSIIPQSACMAWLVYSEQLVRLTEQNIYQSLHRYTFNWWISISQDSETRRCLTITTLEFAMKKLQENSCRNMNEWNSSAGVYGGNLLCKNINIINSQLQKIYEMPVQMLAYNLKHTSQCKTRSKYKASQPILWKCYNGEIPRNKNKLILHSWLMNVILKRPDKFGRCTLPFISIYSGMLFNDNY